MNFWPFTRPSPELRFKTLRRDVDTLELELVELREDWEKLMAAVKRIQGKTYRRKRADMEEIAAGATPDGGEPVSPPAAPDGGPELHTVAFPADPKHALRKRAAQLRGR